MDLSTVKWRKSSRSSADGDNCVEVANVPNIVALRDSKYPNGGKILLSHEDFRHLTNTLKNL
ncbi:uncharacterized protein DUF397 [Actinomadura pelletieri DSM 43383]|uniref:Uncharacterized protein DUF397 n=1 Tax=Actinomadura pelletieri DSM 43383 TaxID=1120940 RepID=A0A495QRR2_9ACTN|nr:DUF397 domain-containing protein [Actinomadura pelletieri]RKS76179.1 uncharacterized protein DUF397 [Actinomadura pelletieri DSM 43383]